MTNNGKRLGFSPGWRKDTYSILTSKHWVIDWSNRQTAKKRHSTYHDVKYVNEYGEPQFLFNQQPTKRRTSRAHQECHHP